MRENDFAHSIASSESFEDALLRTRYNGIMRLVDAALSADDYRGFITNAADTLTSLFSASLVTVYLLSPDKKEFIEQTNHVRRFSNDSVDFARLPREVGDIQQLFVGRQLLPMNFGTARAGSEYDAGVGEKYVCAVCVPLFIDAEAFGFFSLVYERAISWPRRDLDYLLTIGHLLGIVFKRVYSANTLSVPTGELRDCLLLSNEIKRELEAILSQTKAEKPQSIADFQDADAEADDRPITPGDAFRPTHRERQLMAYAAEGLTNKEISQKLSISESAVKKMFVRIARNSGLRNRAHIAAYAVRNGFAT